MGFNRFTGRIADDQDWLNREFFELYREKPATHDMMLDKDRIGTVIFDGTHWRKFDLKNLRRAAAEKERNGSCNDSVSWPS